MDGQAQSEIKTGGAPLTSQFPTDEGASAINGGNIRLHDLLIILSAEISKNKTDAYITLTDEVIH